MYVYGSVKKKSGEDGGRELGDQKYADFVVSLKLLHS